LNKEIITQVAYKGAIELIINDKIQLGDLTKTVKSHTGIMMSLVSDSTGDHKVVPQKTENKLQCPACGKNDWLEDNRPKKTENPAKFGKIPNFSCSDYQDNKGCGYATYDDELQAYIEDENIAPF